MYRFVNAKAYVLSVGLILGLSACAVQPQKASQPQDLQWHYYGQDAQGTKYSPADQIDAGNVQNLEVAWRWQNPDDDLGQEVRQRPGHFKATPLMVDGTLYVSTGLSVAAAIDAGSGETLWVFNPEAYKLGRPANTGWQHRGLAYWQDDAGNDRRVVYATGTGELIALNARTGQLIPSFGAQGRVDLQAGIVEKSGSWFSHDSQRIGQGRENVRQFLRENMDVANSIEHKIRESAGILSSEMMTPSDLVTGPDLENENGDEALQLQSEE